MRNLKLLIFIIFSFLACKNEGNETTIKVTIYDYQIWLSDLNKIDLRYSALAYRKSIKNDFETIFRLQKNLKNDTILLDTYFIKNDSLFYSGEYSKTIDTININFKNEIITVYVSEYDKMNSYDEESYIYWNLEQGIFAIYNYPMGALILHDSEQFKNFAKVEIYNYIIDLEKNKRQLMMHH